MGGREGERPTDEGLSDALLLLVRPGPLVLACSCLGLVAAAGPAAVKSQPPGAHSCRCILLVCIFPVLLLVVGNE